MKQARGLRINRSSVPNTVDECGALHRREPLVRRSHRPIRNRVRSLAVDVKGQEGARCRWSKSSGRYPFLNPVPFEEILPDERIKGHESLGRWDRAGLERDQSS